MQSDIDNNQKIKSIEDNLISSINSTNEKIKEKLRNSLSKIDFNKNDINTFDAKKEHNNMEHEFSVEIKTEYKNLVDKKQKIFKYITEYQEYINNLYSNINVILQANHTAEKDITPKIDNISMIDLKNLIKHKDNELFDRYEINLRGKITITDLYLFMDDKYITSVILGPLNKSLLPLQKPDTTDLGDFTGFNYIYISKAVYLLHHIINSLKIISINIDNIIEHIDSDYFYEIYHRIGTNILTAIINIFQNMLYFKGESSSIINQTNQIFSRFEELHHKNSKINISTAYEIAKNVANDINKIIDKKFNEELYTFLQEHFMKEINKLFQLLNKKSASTYTSAFFETKFEQIETDKINNFFDRPYKNLAEFPTKLDDYISKYVIYEPHEQKQKLYEDFIPQIDTENYYTYYYDYDSEDKIKKLKISVSAKILEKYEELDTKS